MPRILSVEGSRLQTLSRRPDRHVVAVAGGRAKLDAVRGALAGRFMNVLVTHEDLAGALVRRGRRRPSRAVAAGRRPPQTARPAERLAEPCDERTRRLLDQ